MSEMSEHARSDIDTDQATDYGSAFEGESEYATDDGDVFDDFLLAPAVIEGADAASAHGLQPYELFRNERRQAREQRLAQADRGEKDTRGAAEAGPAGDSPVAPGATGDAAITEAAKLDLKRQTVGSRRRLGYGRIQRKRRPSHVSRGQLPPQGVDLMTQANHHMIKGEFNAALHPLMTCIRRYPNFVEPYTSLAAAFTGLQQHKQALQCYATALHMKPNAKDTAELCARQSFEHGFYKQAIWAWTKYIKEDRGCHDAHEARLEAYTEYLCQLGSGRRGVARAAKMGLAAAKSMLASFPGDAYAATKVPWFLYRTGDKAKAIDFLAEFLVKYPSNASPTHANILAELHMELGNHAAALAAMQTVLTRDDCKQHVDLVAKFAVCSVHVGNLDHALEFVECLHNSEALGAAVTDATELPDLFVEVAQAFQAKGKLSHLSDFFQFYIDCFRQALDAPDNDTAAANAQVADLVQMQPQLQAFATAAGNSWAPTQTLHLLYNHLPRDHPEYEMLMLKFVELLKASRDEESQELASCVLAELHADPNASLEVQVKHAQSCLTGGDREQGLQYLAEVVEVHVRLTSESTIEWDSLFSAIDAATKKRLMRMLKRGVPASGAARGDDAPTGAEDIHLVLDATPGLALSTGRKKDRRTDSVRELDIRAQAILEAHGKDKLKELISGCGAVRRLIDHPVLFPMVYEMLEWMVDRREHDWLDIHCPPLLKAFRQADTGVEMRRRRALILVAHLRSRLERSEPEVQDTAEFRNLLLTWPYSVQVANLFTILSHLQGVMPQWRIYRSVESHRDSIPLQLLHGHTLLLAYHPSAALRDYLNVLRMLPNDPLVNLVVGVAHLHLVYGPAPAHRQSTVLKAFAFMHTYAANSENRQEAAYNLGRAFHMLDLKHLAAHWYERSLGFGFEDGAQLSYEAAFNLQAIYRNSGATQRAALLLQKYCIL